MRFRLLCVSLSEKQVSHTSLTWMGLFQAGVALLKRGMRSDMVALTDDRKDIAVLSLSAQFSER